MKNKTPKGTIFITTASSIGSVLEMYDFVIYIILASVLATVFFPAGNSYINILKVFGIFAVGYLARPLGGVIFGHIADRYGRQRGLILSMIMMGLPVFLVGLLPGYQTIGYLAPILLLILRFIGGISVAGEFSTGTTYLTEHASNRWRGFISSFLFFGINFGILLASAVGAVITLTVSHQVLIQWAWRIPFLLGGILAIVGYLIRKRMIESPVFEKIKQENDIAKRPILELLRNHSSQIARAFTLISVMAASISLLYLYMPTYLHVHLHKSIGFALKINTYNLLLFTLLIPVFAWLSDLTSRNLMLILSAILFLFLSIPLYHLMNQGSSASLILSLFSLSVIAAMFVGPIAATLAERFRARTRSTGIGLSYNLSFALFGGFAPIAVTYLIHLTQTNLAPAFYLMVCALLSLIAVISFRDFTGESMFEIEKKHIELGKISQK